MLKRAQSRRCEVNTLWKLACNCSTFFKVSRRELFRKSLTESKGNDRFYKEKF